MSRRRPRPPAPPRYVLVALAEGGPPVRVWRLWDGLETAAKEARVMLKAFPEATRIKVKVAGATEALEVIERPAVEAAHADATGAGA